MGLNPQILQPDFITMVRMGMFSWVSMGLLRAHSEAITTTSGTITPSHVSIARISAASTVGIASDNANDTNGGTGARVVLVDGLNASFEPQQELVTMAGSARVETVNAYAGINNILVTAAGDVGTNAGNIHAGEGTFTSGVPATDYYVTPASYGTGWTGVQYVPNNKKWLPKQLICTLRDTSKTLELDIRLYDKSAGVDRNIAPIGAPASDIEFDLLGPVFADAGDWIHCESFVDTGTAAVTIFLLGLIIDADRVGSILG
jgi:hypothetical protein